MTNRNYTLEILTGAALVSTVGCKAIPSTAVEGAFDPVYVQSLKREMAGIKNALTNPTVVMPGVYGPSLKVKMDGTQTTIEYRTAFDPKSDKVTIQIADGKVISRNGVNYEQPIELQKVDAKTMYESWSALAKKAEEGISAIAKDSATTKELDKTKGVYEVKADGNSYMLDFADDGQVEQIVAATGKLEVVLPNATYKTATDWKAAYDAKAASVAVPSATATPTPSASEGLEAVVAVDSTPAPQADSNWTDPLLAAGIMGYVIAASFMKSPFGPVIVAAKSTYNFITKPFRKAPTSAASNAEKLEVMNEVPAADPSGLPLTPDGSSGPATISLPGATKAGSEELVLEPNGNASASAPKTNAGDGTDTGSLQPIEPDDQPPQPPSGGGNSASAA